MLEAGIRQPEAVCVATARGALSREWDSYYVIREVENSQCLEALLERLERNLDSQLLERLAGAVVKTLSLMNSHGFCHWDFKPRNILVVANGDDMELCPIDSRSGRKTGVWNRRHCRERDRRFVLRHPLLGPAVAKLLDGDTQGREA